MTRGAYFEALLLHRAVRFWFLGFLVIWVAALRLQEPNWARREGIPFFWAGVESTVLLSLGLLPLVWALARGQERDAWTLRLSSSPWAWTVSCWVALLSYGVLMAALTGAVAFTLDSMYAIPAGAEAPVVIALEAMLLLAPAAALAPGLAAARIPVHWLVFAWLLLLTASWLYGIPIPTRALLALDRAAGGITELLSPRTAFSTLQATCAGLFLSWALVQRRVAR